MHLSIYYCFFRFFSLIGYYKMLSIVICAIQKVPADCSFSYSSVYMSSPTPNLSPPHLPLGSPSGTSYKECVSQCSRYKTCGFDPWVRKIAWGRTWQPTPVFLPGKPCRQRGLVGLHTVHVVNRKQAQLSTRVDVLPLGQP